MQAGSSRLRTDKLMKRLFRAGTPEEALGEEGEFIEKEDFSACVLSLCAEKGMIPERIIRDAGIDRTYGHQLFNGTRMPSRDKAIQIAFGFGLNVEETQRLLRAAHKSVLYPRLKRDAVIIYCLQKKKDLSYAQQVLRQYGLTALGEAKKYEE